MTLLIAANAMGSPWDTVTEVEGRMLTGHTGWVQSVAFRPDGRTIASGSHDGTVILWEDATSRKNPDTAGIFFATTVSV